MSNADNNPAGQPSGGEGLAGIGERLAHARERRGMDRDEVAERLRLPLEQVEALEAGDDSAFSAPIYVRGHAANYARLVGLSPNRLLADWEPPALRPRPQSTGGRMPGHRIAENVARWATYLVGTAVVLLPIWWWAAEGTRTAGPTEGPDGATGQVAESGASGNPLSDNPAGRGGPGRRASGGPVLASMTPIGIVDGQPLAGPPVPERVKRRQAAENGSADTPTTANATGGTGAGRATADPPRATIVLALSADSWVEISDARGKRLEYDLLRSGTTHTYTGRPPFEVLLGNAPGVDLEFNGTPFDFSAEIEGNLARFTVSAHPEQG